MLPALARAETALDVLVRAQPGAYGLTYQQIRAELAGALGETQ